MTPPNPGPAPVVPENIQTLLDGFVVDYVPTLEDGCRYATLSAPYEADNGKYFGYSGHCTTMPDRLISVTVTDTAANWANTVDDCSNVLMSRNQSADTETRVYAMGAPAGQFTTAWYRPNPVGGSAPNLNEP